MSRRTPTTSLRRTYRYLRIAVAGSVLVVFTAIAFAMPDVGLLPSISHYFYTPANAMFTGALIAVSVCLFSLSGRGIGRVLLNAAAALAPLVAIVPTTIAPGSAPGVAADCAGGVDACVPAAFDPAVDNGVATYLVIGVLVVILAVVLTLLGQVGGSGTAVSIAVAATILLAVWLTWWLARAAFVQGAHTAAAMGFFAAIVAVAVANVFAPSLPDPPPGLKVAYIVIAVAMTVIVAGIPLYGPLHAGPVYGTFVGEVVALVLFATFWILQSVQYWQSDDPAVFAE